MYKFTVEYYCSKYHTGEVNYTITRKGTVYATDKNEAVKKILEADDNYIAIASIEFEEIRGVRKNDL